MSIREHLKSDKGQIIMYTSIGIFAVSVIGGLIGVIYNDSKEVMAQTNIRIDQQSSIIQKLTDNETNISTLLARQDERLKYIESRIK